MAKVPEELVEETKATIRLYLFLRHECGLRYADRLNVKDIKEFLSALRR